MAQVQLNRSSVAGYVPTSLLTGSLFYNSADNKLYVGADDSTPVLLSSDPSGIVAQLGTLESDTATQALQIAALQAEVAQPTTTVSTTAPSNPAEGSIWYNTVSGQMMVYTTEWVQANTLNVVTTGPSGTYPITVAEFFEHIVLTPDAAEEAQAVNIIAAATRWAEMYTGRMFITTALTCSMDSFPGKVGGSKQPIRLTGGVPNSITAVSYINSAGVLVTLDASDYRLVSKHGNAHLYSAIGSSWPSDVAAGEPDVVTVTYSVGDDPVNVPAPLKIAVLMIAASLWENRENDQIGQRLMSLKPTVAAKDLLHPYKLR